MNPNNTPASSENPDFLDYDETCQHARLEYHQPDDSLILVKPNGIEVVPAFLPSVSEVLTVEETDRLLSVWNACRHVNPETLVPGILMDLLQLLPNIAWYLESQAETERKDSDNVASTLLKSLQPFL